MMAEAAQERLGPEKAAIFLLSLGEAQAADMLKHLNAKEVESVGAAMAAIEAVETDTAYVVLDDFLDACNDDSIGVNVPKYLKRVFNDALGSRRGPVMIDKVLEEEDSELESLQWMDVDSIMDMLKDEHPQIVAITLAYLDEEKSAKVLAELPPASQNDIIMRISTLGEIPESALQELERILDKQFLTTETPKTLTLDGPQTASRIISNVDKENEKLLMEYIAEKDEELAQKISELMFVFDDLSKLDDKAIQRIMRDTSNDVLVLSLKGADEAVKNKIYNNISKRAKEMLEEDMETRGPVKISDVEDAQKQFMEVVAKLADAEEITLGEKGDEYV
ncbi:MAG: flagellar motor switch protein FliG [Pseudomonadales bacterium]|nr:flagellar motor switch protein FliG [Pseudomonadales bacterium]